jgi:hypothetical protein
MGLSPSPPPHDRCSIRFLCHVERHARRPCSGRDHAPDSRSHVLDWAHLRPGPWFYTLNMTHAELQRDYNGKENETQLNMLSLTWRRSSTAATSPAMVALSAADSSRLISRRRRRVLHKRARLTVTGHRAVPPPRRPRRAPCLLRATPTARRSTESCSSMLSTFSNSSYRLPPHPRESRMRCHIHGAQVGCVRRL